MRAFINIKEQPHYRRQSFERGLQRHGYTIEPWRPGTVRADRVGPGDVLVSWNLYGQAETEAQAARALGATVLVVENGIVGTDAEGRQLYTICRDQHHAGTWHVGDVSRWQALGIAVRPWTARTDGPVLVCQQRGIGSRLMASPPAWEQQTAAQIKRAGFNPIVRPHPGWMRRIPELQQQLRGVAACAVWSSMAGVKALIDGVPVAYWAPAWVAAPAARRKLDGIVAPLRDDAARLAALTAVAWYQWTVAEIEAGEPFVYLLTK